MQQHVMQRAVLVAHQTQSLGHYHVNSCKVSFFPNCPSVCGAVLVHRLPCHPATRLQGTAPRHQGACVTVRAYAAAVPAPEERHRGLQAHLPSMARPFSNPACNAKLLALCTAQMLVSLATLMHDTFLPVYLSDVLHLNNQQIGNLQALSMFLSKAAGSLSGTLADLLSPARMALLGLLLTAVNKPMFALSGGVYRLLGATACLNWMTFAKIVDRMCKGVREAPSKALIGELAARSGDSPAAAFSLRLSMGTFGALLGAGAASLAFHLSGRSYVLTFALAAVPALLALGLVAWAFGGDGDGSSCGGVGRSGASCAAVTVSVRRSEAKDSRAADVGAAAMADSQPVALSMLGKARALLTALQPAYWEALAVICILYFARFDASFIMLRAKTVVPPSRLPALTSLSMMTTALFSTPAGLHAKTSVQARNALLLAGIGVQVAANLCLCFIPSMTGMMLGSVGVGLHMAMTHGVALGMLSSYIPTAPVPGLGRITGTAWSLTDFMLGLVLAYSNSVAGRLTDLTVRSGWGNIGCFLGGVAACTASMLALLLFSTWGHLGREELLAAR